MCVAIVLRKTSSLSGFIPWLILQYEGFGVGRADSDCTAIIANVLSQSRVAGIQLKTIFLDRDGVINKKMPEGNYVRAIEDFQLLPGVAEAIAALNRAGMRVIVVSNQRGIALGLYTAEAVDAIHRHLQSELGGTGARIDGFFYCPHDKKSCECRKPLPGLYQQAEKQYPEITPETSAMLGDSLSDIEFGRAIGMITVWIAGPKESRKPGWESAANLADMRCDSLLQAVEELLQLPRSASSIPAQ